MKIIDAHVHLQNAHVAREVSKYLSIESVVNIPYLEMSTIEDMVATELNYRKNSCNTCELQYYYCTTLPVGQLMLDGNIDAILDKINSDISKPDVVAVKIWKDVGMCAVKEDGSYLLHSDNIFFPLFEMLDNMSATCIVHVADPIEAWSLKANSLPYFKENPSFNMSDRPNAPSHDIIIRGFINVVSRWRNVRFVAAHMCNLMHDLRKLDRMLIEHPNLFVDSAGRHEEILAKPGKQIRDFFIRHQDRILYGSDWTEISAIEKETLDQYLQARRTKYKNRVKEMHEVIKNDNVLKKYYYNN